GIDPGEQHVQRTRGLQLLDHIQGRLHRPIFVGHGHHHVPFRPTSPSHRRSDTPTSADDPRTPDQRRADALVDLGVAALHDPLLPKAQGMRPSIQVTVALSTLLGDDEQPGELAGPGPLPASAAQSPTPASGARRLAADESGTWRRLVTDPLSGQLLDYGHDTYRPPKDLAD